LNRAVVLRDVLGADGRFAEEGRIVRVQIEGRVRGLVEDDRHRPEATFGILATTDAVAETPQEAKPRTRRNSSGGAATRRR
jgi:hypothetical protein